MGHIELIGVPFDGYGRPGNQARAAATLRDAGLRDAFAAHDVTDTGDLELPAPQSVRGARTTLINEPALLAMIDAVSLRVEHAIGAGRFPVIFGGDCTTLLGSMAGLQKASSEASLLFIDGHEDTMPLDVSEDGEAANAEIGILLGLTGRTLQGSLATRRNLLSADRLAMIGQRDRAWRQRFNVGTIADVGVWSRTAAETANDPIATTTAALEHLRRHVDRWWLHIDLDVLDPAEFPAQGLPGVPDDPGGLTWEQLRAVATTGAQAAGCAGWSVAIYDPDQDPTREGAEQIVQLARRVAEELP